MKGKGRQIGLINTAAKQLWDGMAEVLRQRAILETGQNSDLVELSPQERQDLIAKHVGQVRKHLNALGSLNCSGILFLVDDADIGSSMMCDTFGNIGVEIKEAIHQQLGASLISIAEYVNLAGKVKQKQTVKDLRQKAAKRLLDLINVRMGALGKQPFENVPVAALEKGCPYKILGWEKTLRVSLLDKADLQDLQCRQLTVEPCPGCDICTVNRSTQTALP